jgi:hypothetical protein
MVRARPWQQLIICVALIAAGIALVGLGMMSGAALIVVGVLFAVPLLLTPVRKLFIARSSSPADGVDSPSDDA